MTFQDTFQISGFTRISQDLWEPCMLWEIVVSSSIEVKEMYQQQANWFGLFLKKW